MREDALKTIIEQHALYLNNGNTGKRANLRDANLQGAIGNMREVRSMQLSQYAVTYTATTVFIGCCKIDLTLKNVSSKQLTDLAEPHIYIKHTILQAACKLGESDKNMLLQHADFLTQILTTFPATSEA